MKLILFMKHNSSVSTYITMIFWN